jgi:hypothetical protein
MSLEAQIQLITVPQEFMRLCNAVLAAEYGDDFLPVDDDRPDRGNDGYVKSEKRVFAAHCFKRAQNQGLDRPIRQKMLGDLGKAKLLKEQDLWEVDAWTFLSNYPISEQLGREAHRIGSNAGIDVSWRGPDYLAGALHRHPDLCELFPSLQVSEIATQLSEIKDAVSGDDSAATLIAPDRVPRTPDETTALMTLRPDGWEYLLFASVLERGRAELEPKWHDHQMPPYTEMRSVGDVGEASDYLAEEFNRLTLMLEAMMRVFEEDAKEAACGAPGEPGDASRIEHMANRIIQTYADMLEWARRIRAADSPPALADVFQIAPDLATQPLQQFRSFFEVTVREIDRVPAFMAGDPSPDAPLKITLSLDMGVDDKLMAEYHRRIKRAHRKVKWGL